MTSRRESGRNALVAIIAERIVAEFLGELEMLEPEQPGDSSFERDQVSDAPGVCE
jgi:hypothetical protein